MGGAGRPVGGGRGVPETDGGECGAHTAALLLHELRICRFSEWIGCVRGQARA